MNKLVRPTFQSRAAAALAIAALLGIVGSQARTPTLGRDANLHVNSSDSSDTRDSAGSTDDTLKSVTEVVNVPVTVRDEDQHLISDLKREDFSITEDGRTQEI